MPSTHATITRDVWGYIIALGIACVACAVVYAAYSEFQIGVRVINALREHGLLQPARLASAGPATATRSVAIFESPALEEGIDYDGNPRHPPVGELAEGAHICVSFYSVGSGRLYKLAPVRPMGRSDASAQRTTSVISRLIRAVMHARGSGPRRSPNDD